MILADMDLSVGDLMQTGIGAMVILLTAATIWKFGPATLAAMNALTATLAKLSNSVESNTKATEHLATEMRAERGLLNDRLRAIEQNIRDGIGKG